MWRIPELGRGSQGRFIENLIALREDETRGQEKVASIIPVKEFDDRFLVTASRNGYIKKTPLEAYSRPKRGGIIGAGLKEGDILVRAALTTGDRDLMISTSQGQTIRFDEQDVRSMGRTAAGVIAVKFKKEGDHVVDMQVADDEAMQLTVCALGYGLRTRVADYPRKRRGGMGVVNVRGLERNGPVVMARFTKGGDDLILISEQGKIVRMPSEEVRLIGRGGQGVRVMGLNEGDRVVAGVLVPQDEQHVEEVDATDPAPAAAETPGAAAIPDASDAPEDARRPGDGLSPGRRWIAARASTTATPSRC